LEFRNFAPIDTLRVGRYTTLLTWSLRSSYSRCESNKDESTK